MELIALFAENVNDQMVKKESRFLEGPSAEGNVCDM